MSNIPFTYIGNSHYFIIMAKCKQSRKNSYKENIKTNYLLMEVKHRVFIMWTTHIHTDCNCIMNVRVHIHVDCTINIQYT